MIGQRSGLFMKIRKMKRTNILFRHLSNGGGAASSTNKIIYTETDEAPQLATYSLLPIIRKFVARAGVKVELSDISLSSRIIAQFNDVLSKEKQKEDSLKVLGQLTLEPNANIIKLPNISASVPQLIEAISELQKKGYTEIPNFTQNPKTPQEKEIAKRYSKVMGSVVNPVLREGNSDRRVAPPVKDHAQKHPHNMMKPYKPDCKAHVAYMSAKDFFESERSAIIQKPCSVKVELETTDGRSIMLKKPFAIEAGEIIDAATMNVAALCDFYKKEILKAKNEGMLLSLHLKATMMKVSDPIMFGHCVKVFYREIFEKYRELFAKIDVNPNNGIGDVYEKVKALPKEQQKQIEKDIENLYKEKPMLAMVDSENGITNLHVPSDMIIDASMPNVIRDGGKMWGPDNKLHETTCMIPDRCYAGVYDEVMKFCKANGAFDPATMGTVNNVGLMAQKAEEYGSHDKTFEIPEAGVVRVTDDSGKVIFEHDVEKGDIWRMCQTKDAAVKDWIKLAVNRARASGFKTIFWLNKKRAHDSSILQKVERYLQDHDLKGLDISVETPENACRISLERAKAGLNSISVTGNVLRDYLTDLFPILELGTSAKMLSIVPLLNGGGMYETGAGGSAPKHVQQFEKEGHLRWDSLGEFLALAVSLEDLGQKSKLPKALLMADTLNRAISKLLENEKSPSRKVKEIDNRGSHFYLALYWAQALAAQTKDLDLQKQFKPIAEELSKNEKKIAQELIDCQGKPVDVGGYYQPDPQKAAAAMRPSSTLNKIIDSM